MPDGLTGAALLEQWPGENILISLIVLAHNAGALRSDTLARVRVPIFLSRRALHHEFTAGEKVAFGA